MADKDNKQVRPYGFTPEYEAAMVALLCSSPRFFGKVGKELEADAMPTAPGRLAVEAAQAIFKDTGSGPGSVLLVIQRLRRLMESGQVTMEEIGSVDDMIAAAEDRGLQDEEGVLAELVPVLKRRLQSKAIHLAMGEFSNRRGMDRVTAMLDRAESLGTADSSLGIKIGGASFDLIAELRYLQRCPTGVTELDNEIGGGLPRGQLGMFIGGSGDGKSMAMSHLSAHASRCGLFVAYATLELPPPVIHARIIANHTNTTIDRVMDGDEDARALIDEYPPAGPCMIKEFPAQVTTVADLKAWVRMLEEDERRSVDVLVVDYADKMTASVKGARGDVVSSYKLMEYVYEQLRLFADEGKRWVWTASAATRADKKGKNSKQVIDLEHTADSQNKVRVADLVITLNVREDGEEMLFYVAKNRTGKSRCTAGPLPTDFACGGIAPVVAENTTPTNALANETEMALGDTGTLLDDM